MGTSNSLNSVLQTPPPSNLLRLDNRDCEECVPPKLPRRPPFGGWGMPGVSLLGLFSQCAQASAFLLVNWSRPHKRSPSPPHLPVQPPLPHPPPPRNYRQSTPNTPSTADRNHLEGLLVPIEPRMCIYNSKKWAISMAVRVVFLWLWTYKKQTVVQFKDQEKKVSWRHEVVTWSIKSSQSDPSKTQPSLTSWMIKITHDMTHTWVCLVV